jgi:hypothetical protein
MPKENINCVGSDGLRVVVGWEAGKDVQIGTTNAQSKLRLDDEPFNGWFGTLDREGCNRLIRSVRLARDKAFGADA